jgi:hypothetical protein
MRPFRRLRSPSDPLHLINQARDLSAKFTKSSRPFHDSQPDEVESLRHTCSLRTSGLNEALPEPDGRLSAHPALRRASFRIAGRAFGLSQNHSIRSSATGVLRLVSGVSASLDGLDSIDYYDPSALHHDRLLSQPFPCFPGKSRFGSGVARIAIYPPT